MLVFLLHVKGPHRNILLDDGHTHLLELSKLAEKDPEFYKYLQENDRELLEFGVEDDSEEMSDVQEDGDEEGDV